DNTHILAYLVFNFHGHVLVLFQVVTDIILALTNARAAVAIPGASLVDNAGLHAQINDFTFARNTRTVHDIELGLFEWRRDLVFDHFDTCFVTDNLVAFFDGADTTNIEANRGIEFKRVTAGRGFRATEHDHDFHSDLVNENDHAISTLDGRGQLTQRLA